MASIHEIKNKNGSLAHKVVFRSGVDQIQRAITFPAKVSRARVERYKTLIEDIDKYLVSQEPFSKSINAQIEELPLDVVEKFERAGLLSLKEKLPLRELVRRYYSAMKKQGLSVYTIRNKTTTLDKLLHFFGDDCPVRKITKRDAEEFREAVSSGRLGKVKASAGTVAGAVKDAKAFFNWAVQSELLDFNPFEKVFKGSMSNKRREHEVTMEQFNLIRDNCNSQEVRTALTLGRIGGLRLPSELTHLKWSDIHWNDENPFIEVYSTKNKRSRRVPLWSDLKEELYDLMEVQTAHGEYSEDGFVIPNYRTEGRLFSVTKKAVLRAGLEVYERLLHNLRGSRSNELFRILPVNVAEEIMDHKYDVAKKHYLHLNDDDIARALDSCDMNTSKRDSLVKTFNQTVNKTVNTKG